MATHIIVNLMRKIMIFVEFIGLLVDKKLLFVLTILALSGQSLRAQHVRIVDYNTLDSVIRTKSDTAKIINLWATWCQPCLDEMPFFVNEHNQWRGKPVSFILVSVDFPSQEENVKKKAIDLKMPGTIIQLEEKNNDWIDKLDKNWSGAIPCTILILPDGKRIEHYDVFSSLQQLDSFLSKSLNQ